MTGVKIRKPQSCFKTNGEPPNNQLIDRYSLPRRYGLLNSAALLEG
jgi:hypothetical protein